MMEYIWVPFAAWSWWHSDFVWHEDTDVQTVLGTVGGYLQELQQSDTMHSSLVKFIFLT